MLGNVGAVVDCRLSTVDVCQSPITLFVQAVTSTPTAASPTHRQPRAGVASSFKPLHVSCWEGFLFFFSVTELTMPLAMETPFALSLSSFYPCMHRQHTQTPSHRHTTNAHIAIYYLASECFGCFALLLLLFCMKLAHFIRTINELFVCYFACVCGKIFADTHLELVLKLCALVTEDANSSSRNDNSSA